MHHEQAVRHVPGLGLVAVEAHVRWAPGVEARPVLTNRLVDEQVEALIDRTAADAVDRLIASLP